MVEGNIKKYYAFSFVFYSFLWLPVWVLFLLDKGFTLTEITLLDTFFFVTIVILSIPVGIFSDKVGRKKTLSFGSFLTGVALILFAESDSFLSVAISYIIWASSTTFIMVGGTAFLYDSLKTLSREEEFKKINGRSIFYAMVAMGIASLAGGRIGEYSLKSPILIASGLCFLACLITFTFKEPLSSAIDKSYARHLGQSILLARENPPLRFLLLFGIFISIIVSIAQIFTQPYFRLLGISITSIGVIYFVFKISVAVSASFAHVMEKKIGELRTLLLIPVFLFVCLLTLSTRLQVIPSFLLLNVIGGFAQPVLNDYINRHLPTERRATVISFQTAVLAAIQLFVEPAMGYVADRFSLMTSFALLACLCFLLILLTFLKRGLFEEG